MTIYPPCAQPPGLWRGRQAGQAARGGGATPKPAGWQMGFHEFCDPRLWHKGALAIKLPRVRGAPQHGRAPWRWPCAIPGSPPRSAGPEGKVVRKQVQRKLSTIALPPETSWAPQRHKRIWTFATRATPHQSTHLKWQLAQQALWAKQGRQPAPLGLDLQPALQHSAHASQGLVPLDHALLWGEGCRCVVCWSRTRSYLDWYQTWHPAASGEQHRSVHCRAPHTRRQQQENKRNKQTSKKQP